MKPVKVRLSCYNGYIRMLDAKHMESGEVLSSFVFVVSAAPKVKRCAWAMPASTFKYVLFRKSPSTATVSLAVGYPAYSVHRSPLNQLDNTSMLPSKYENSWGVLLAVTVVAASSRSCAASDRKRVLRGADVVVVRVVMVCVAVM